MLVRFDTAISSFAEDNFDFKKDHAQQNEMLRRYDEVITQKCNKRTLTEEVKKLYQVFGPEVNDLKSLQENLGKDVAEMKVEARRVEESVESNTLSILNHFMAERAELDKKCLEDPLQDKKIPDGVARALSEKVDVQDLSQLQETKANKHDLEQVGGQISVLQKELSHILVLLNETLKLNLPVKNSSLTDQEK